MKTSNERRDTNVEKNLRKTRALLGRLDED